MLVVSYEMEMLLLSAMLAFCVDHRRAPCQIGWRRVVLRRAVCSRGEATRGKTSSVVRPRRPGRRRNVFAKQVTLPSGRPGGSVMGPFRAVNLHANGGLTKHLVTSSRIHTHTILNFDVSCLPLVAQVEVGHS